MNHAFTVQYWLDSAKHVAQASTCRKNVGAVIVRRNELVGAGYVGSVHGFPHCTDVDCCFVDTDLVGSDTLRRTCIRTIHAEMNAVLRCLARGSENDGWLEAYCTHCPCLNCLKALLQVGVRSVWFQYQYRDEWRDVFLRTVDMDIVQDGEAIGWRFLKQEVPA